MIVKRKGGWKIKSHRTGKIFPKLYKSRQVAQKRIKQMKAHA